AGMYVNSGAQQLREITFKDNTAAKSGGALLINSGTSVIDRAFFIANTAGQHGGAYYNGSAALTISNSVFSRNKITSASAYYGGAVYGYAGSMTISNSTFSNNSISYSNASTASYGGALYRRSGTVSVNNSIFWGNMRGGGISDQLNAAINVANSLMKGGYASGTFVMDTDPQFNNALADDLSLSGCSPAINVGDNSYALTTEDLGGNTRIAAGTVDMGAFEYQALRLEL